VAVFDYLDGAIKIKWNDRDLPYRIFDKIQKVDQGEIVSNKRLGSSRNALSNVDTNLSVKCERMQDISKLRLYVNAM
jgi:hypothetical protein